MTICNSLFIIKKNVLELKKPGLGEGSENRICVS